MTHREIELAKKIGLGIRDDVSSFRYVDNNKGVIMDICEESIGRWRFLYRIMPADHEEVYYNSFEEILDSDVFMQVFGQKVREIKTDNMKWRKRKEH
jgi:hypothetical protein